MTKTISLLVSKSFLSVLCLLIVILMHVPPSQAQKRQILIQDDIFLSSAEIVANDQHIGLFDGAQKQFYLFDHATGEFLTKIDARDSYPGFNWFPIRPKLLQNEVFFTNSVPWGVYISYENKVTHVAERTFWQLEPTILFTIHCMSDSIHHPMAITSYAELIGTEALF